MDRVVIRQELRHSLSPTAGRISQVTCARATYARWHLAALKTALAYLAREVRRLENQVSGERRRAGGNRGA